MLERPNYLERLNNTEMLERLNNTGNKAKQHWNEERNQTGME